MRPTAKITAPLIFTLAAFSTSICLAGRPLTVDDANVNEVGAGQLETWYVRQADGVNVWTVAPAYGLVEGVEIGASWSRDITNNVNSTAVQAKFRLTPSLEQGCNVGAVIGVSQPNDGSGNTPYLNGLLSCNGDAGSLHSTWAPPTPWWPDAQHLGPGI